MRKSILAAILALPAAAEERDAARILIAFRVSARGGGITGAYPGGYSGYTCAATSREVAEAGRLCASSHSSRITMSQIG